MTKLSLVPWVLDAGSIEATIQEASRLGVDGIELGGWDGVEIDRVKRVVADQDLDIARVAAAGETVGIENVRPAVVDPESVEQSIADLERSITAAERLGAQTLLVTVGQGQDRVAPHRHHVTLVRVLREIAPLAERADVTVVPEVLNVQENHPGYYLSSSYEAYEIIEAVDSPSVKVLYDIYHQQITEGNVITNLRNNIEYIGHIHFADVPGRHEPGTGELNFENVFATIADIEYTGYVGAELRPTGDPAQTVTDLVAMLD